MAAWILGILGIAVFVAAVYAVATSGPKARAREMRRKRFHLPESDERVELAREQPAGGPHAPAIAEEPAVSRPAQRAENPADRVESIAKTLNRRPIGGAKGRLVETGDGESILTTPPFLLRDAIFSHRSGRYVAAIYRRVPPWVIVCPKVRLDALLTPTPPDGRDADDWRTWRQRVRMRSVDLVLCDRRTWRPLLAIVIDHAAPDARVLGGGKDRIIDEVLGVVGLPFVRGTGRFVDDWPRIRPYIEQAILPAADEPADAPDESQRTRPSGAVALLRMDEKSGWLLE